MNTSNQPLKRQCNLGILIAIITLLTSCTSYQYVTLNSNLAKSESQEFVHENDTVRISYSFIGNNCPLTINVYNKLSKPLFVDWTKSAIIIDGLTSPLKPNIATINASMSQTQVQWPTAVSTSDGEISGTLQQSEQISFIPPMASCKETPINVVNAFVSTKANDSISSATLYTASGPVSVKKHSFSKEQTPLLFRCFLTYADNTKFKNAHFSDNTFWATNAIVSTSKSSLEQPNQFYVSKTTGVGTVLGCLFLMPLIITCASFSAP